MNTLLIEMIVAVTLLLIIAIVVFIRCKNYIVALISILGPAAYMVLTSLPGQCNAARVADPCNWKLTYLPISLGVTFLLMTPAIYLVLTGIVKIFLSGKQNRSVAV